MYRTRKSQYSIQRLALIGLLAFFLSGCVSLSDPETSQVHQQEVVYTLPANGSDWLGQTFISRRKGLNSITIQVSPSGDPSTPSYINVELFHSVEDNTPIYSTRQKAGNGSLLITFPAQNDPPGQAYFLKLRAAGQPIQIKGRGEDIYPDGLVYANGDTINGDIAFSTTYDYDLPAFLSDIRLNFPGIFYLFAAITVLLLPGLFILNLFIPKNNLDLGESTAVAAGLSLAILPLLMLWTGLVHLSWSHSAVLFGFFAGLLGLSVLVWRHKPWRAWSPDYFDLSLVLIFIASLAVRLIMIRDMAGTAWIDSVHHGLVTRLILENGAFPSSFLPYFDISPTDYHPGFHTGVAVFTWLSQLDMDRAMLIYGQVLNAMVVFAVYLFSKTMTNSKLAGVVAALAAGLCTPMPAYYTTWGRYTQLAGTLILPVPLLLYQKSLEDYPNTWRTLAVACIAAAGLVLVHYRVMAFLAILMGLYFIIYQLTDKSRWQDLQRASTFAFTCVVAVGLFSAPWLIPTVTRTLAPLAGKPTVDVKWFSDFSWRLLTAGFGQPVMVFAVFGIAAALLLRERLGYLLALWVAALFLLANPTKIGLPSSLVNNTSVVIFLFMPLSALAGYAIDLVSKASLQLSPGLNRPLMVSLVVAGLVTAWLGSQRLLPILNTGTLLIREADLPALSWAAENIPPQSVVAINPFLWGYGLYAGSDGGFWISPIAGLRTMPPPVLSAMESWRETSALSKQIIEHGRNSSELAELLRENGINYVYLGARGGAISPSALLADPQYQVLYQAGGVYIFRLLTD